MGSTPQTITFGALSTLPHVPAAPVTLVASSDSGLPVAFAVTSGPATVSGTALTVTGPGSIVIEATQAGNGTYAAATPVDRTLVVTQTITFGPLPPLPAKPAGAVTIAATSDSGLTVSLSVVSGPASISGNQLTITGAGSIVIRGTQAGNGSYAAAAPVDVTLVVASLSVRDTDALCRSAGAGREAFALAMAIGYCMALGDPLTYAKVEAVIQNGLTPYTDGGRTALMALVAAA